MILNKRFYHDGPPIVELPSGASEAIAEFKNLIRSGAINFEDADCLCGVGPNSNDAFLLSTRDRYGFRINTWLSQRSGIAWTSPRMTQSSREIFYNGYFQRIYRGERDAIYRRFAEQILRIDPAFTTLARPDLLPQLEGKTIFDIGCGAGGMLFPFKAAGAKVYGCDLGGEEYLKFGNAVGLNLSQGDEDTLKCHAPADLIIVSHVLEHLSNPIDFLVKLRSLLHDGGLIYVEVPGIRNLATYQYDFLRYLQNSHLYHYCKDTLAKIVEQSGFSVVHIDETCRCYAKKNEDDSARPSDWDIGLANSILEYLRRCERIHTRKAVTQRLRRILVSTFLGSRPL